ncbi:cryptochrome DASH-like [Pomacea canaliculata]|uniref:cryptochrome DASH-like n=1 Tax=Pomacea canaliculata TaxID=400727 RepID=UPI000D7327FC|nr:cryptochrome DASH-like [Pomacea canaliculata]
MKQLSIALKNRWTRTVYTAFSSRVNAPGCFFSKHEKGGIMKTVIYLFRNDLRLHDNESLYWACQNADTVLPVYCFDPRHFGKTWHFGFAKTGPHRLKFLVESVVDLRGNLQKHGSDLMVRQGKPEDVIPDIISQLGKDNVEALVYQKEVTQEELDVEEALKLKSGVKVHTVWGHTMVHIDDLPFKPQTLPNAYTQFRKKVEESNRMRKELPIPDKLKPLPAKFDVGTIPTFDDFKIPMSVPVTHTVFPFPGGETSALARLQSYFWETDNVAKYKDTRNGMIGSDYSTKFSPWLAHGCISPRRIYWEIKRYEQQRTANESTYWVLFELLWRDYFRFVALKYGNKIFKVRGIQDKDIPWKKDEKLFEAWREGRTGVPYIDANMRELQATGFMSNRGRQNAASFLIKDLQIDWRIGAEWFESILIDHDVCSNYGNWLYIAGIGNDPRENRKFNVIKQGLDYDANGDYVRLWVPELSKVKRGSVHVVWTLSPAALSSAQVSIGESYPAPLVMAPEWRHHYGRPASDSVGKRGRGRGPEPSPKQRGINFYFHNSSQQ